MSSDYFEQRFFSQQTNPALRFAEKRRSQCFAPDTESSSEVELYTWTYSISTPDHEDGEPRERGVLTPQIIRVEKDIPTVATKPLLPNRICADDSQGTCWKGITYM